MRNFLREIKDKVLVYDGSKGIMLQRMGLKGGECPEEWNVKHSEKVKEIYRLYRDAGSDVIQTNTFQGNRAVLEKYGLGDKTFGFNFEGARLAREVMGREGFVAASIGPIGKLFEPSGELTFNTAYEIYKEQVKAVVDGGVDIINFETFTDLAEMRAALIAAKEVSQLPVICSMSFETNGRTLMGSDPYVCGIVLKSLGADIIGTNCSFGPQQQLEIVQRMADVGGIYLSVKPNAGLPKLVDGNFVYDEPIDKFAGLAEEFVKYGARLIGGCCGTTPEYISAIKSRVGSLEVSKAAKKCERVITSDVNYVNLEENKQLNIGLLNTENDSRLLNELTGGNLEYITDKALDMAYEGYDAIYINVEKVIKQENILGEVLNIAQSYIKAPFIVDTNDSKQLEHALRVYKGKAGVIVENAEAGIEPLLTAAKKYGSTVVGKNEIKL